MPIPFQVILSPEDAAHDQQRNHAIAKSVGIPFQDVQEVVIEKQSIDARRSHAVILLKGCIYQKNEPLPEPVSSTYMDADSDKRVIVVGCGPAGLFAALTLLEKGYKPILLERGKDISERKKDIAALQRQGIINPDSNYCFGEGGAGTFSDGKLYTRSTKRGDVRNILRKLLEHGAIPAILYEAHPHIGTDKLPAIIKNMRQTILQHGGEVHFNTRCEHFILDGTTVKGVIDQHGQHYDAAAVILATGHSARDIYACFEQNQWALLPKAFAVGVRVEHPQALINKIQYHQSYKNSCLPAARYQLTTQAGGRGIFSFCMCPGGIIIPSATAPEQLLVNGMSNAAHNSPYANAGIVVTVSPADFTGYGQSVLSGLFFQMHLEKQLFMAANRTQAAPAQRMTDFVEGKCSASLPKSSYHPGLTSLPLTELLPSFIGTALQQAFPLFDKKMKGFYTREALLIAAETRTSAPVFIPRGDDGQHIQLKNLYPCGEGAGYAGGIVSAALDGVNTAKLIHL